MQTRRPQAGLNGHTMLLCVVALLLALLASSVPAMLRLVKRRGRGGGTSFLSRSRLSGQYWPRRVAGADSEPRLRRTAVVTLVQGEMHARMAVALLQSLRDVGTRIPHVVILVGRGHAGGAECEGLMAEGLRPEGWCQREGAPIGDLLSGYYIRALEGLGATLRPLMHVPRSQYVTTLTGGWYGGWGAAFNKVQVLQMTEFRRILWMDCDTLVLRNLDHLLLQEPLLSDPTAFMAAVTIGCCDLNVFGKMGGSLWAFAPSALLYDLVLNKSFTPCPLYEDGRWMEGDQSVVAHAVGSPFSKAFRQANIRGWPWIDDMTQGVIPGVTLLPHYRNEGEDHLAVMRTGVAAPKLTEHLSYSLAMRFPPSVFGEGFKDTEWVYTEGHLPARLLPPPVSDLGILNSGPYRWEPLDARYDIMVGSCECVPQHDLEGREQEDSVGEQFTAHFSCFYKPLVKPASYTSEEALFDALYAKAFSCQRKYYLRWYETYVRALSAPGVLRGGEEGEAAGEPPRPGLPRPLWDGPAVPGINATHDAAVTRPCRGKWCPPPEYTPKEVPPPSPLTWKWRTQ